MKKLTEGRAAYLIAAGVALVGALMMQNRVSSAMAEPSELALRETYRVVVAARDLQAGAVLSSDDLTLEDIRFEKLPRHVVEIGKKEEQPVGEEEADQRWQLERARLIGRELAVELKRGDPLLLTDFVGGRDYTLGSALNSDQRGVAIQVDRAALMGGLLLPNDRVDVVSIYRAAIRIGSEIQESYDKAKVVLKDVTVLSVGGRMSRQAERGGGGDETTVVLALTPDQALSLALVQQNARLSLLLRPSRAGTRAGDYRADEIDMKNIADMLGDLSREPAQ